MDRNNNNRDDIPDIHNLPPNKKPLKRWKTIVTHLNIETREKIETPVENEWIKIDKQINYEITKKTGTRYIEILWKKANQYRLFGD